MYGFLLALHSIVRWFVIGAGVVATGRALVGSLGRPWSARDDVSSRLFTIALDVQVLIGLVMFTVVSPITTSAFHALGASVQNGVVRFWVVEHPMSMVLALAWAHLGLARIRRVQDHPARHRRALVFFGLALVLVLLGTPWPFSAAARPWWRGW